METATDYPVWERNAHDKFRSANDKYVAMLIMGCKKDMFGA